jgi:hypothetical protein
MSLIQDFTRRLKQLHLLFDAPPELRREYQRHQIAAVLDIMKPDGTGQLCHSTDISHGGIFVEPQIDVEPETEILVSVGDLLKNAPALVVAQRGEGTALRFRSVVHGAALTAWLVNHPSGRLRH